MQIARRYSNLDALAEYFELIFALGRKDEAWRIYQEVYRDGNGGRVLSAIAQHARQIGWSDQQVIDWLATPKNSVLADDTFFYAPRAALGAVIIDRSPIIDLAGVLRRFNVPSPYGLDGTKGKILRRKDPKRPADQAPQVCGPSLYGGGPVGGMAKVQDVGSSLSYFAQGYQALDQRRYASRPSTWMPRRGFSSPMTRIVNPCRRCSRTWRCQPGTPATPQHCANTCAA